MTLRAALLLIALPALLPADPAPLPRQKRAAPTGGWSKPVEGLRVRLLAPQKRYRAGEAVRLMLEIQNVSGKALDLEDPELYPAVVGSEGSGWMIVGKRLGGGEAPREVKAQQRLAAIRRLGAGTTLRIEIAATAEDAAKAQQEQTDDGPRRQELYFPDGESAGCYEFRATFRRAARRKESFEKETWNADRLSSPSVWVELEK